MSAIDGKKCDLCVASEAVTTDTTNEAYLIAGLVTGVFVYQTLAFVDTLCSAHLDIVRVVLKQAYDRLNPPTSSIGKEQN